MSSFSMNSAISVVAIMATTIDANSNAVLKKIGNGDMFYGEVPDNYISPNSSFSFSQTIQIR